MDERHGHCGRCDGQLWDHSDNFSDHFHGLPECIQQTKQFILSSNTLLLVLERFSSCLLLTLYVLGTSDLSAAMAGLSAVTIAQQTSDVSGSSVYHHN
jgi:hypothetical protein